MMTTLQAPERHRVHDALEHLPGFHQAEGFAHDHSPLRRYRLDLEDLEVELTLDELLEQLHVRER
jgi:hypothetical protein